MNSEEIFNKITTILIEEFEVESSLISKDASIYKDLELDSLDAIDLILNISNAYDIDISNESIEEAKTIQNLIDVIEIYLNK